MGGFDMEIGFMLFVDEKKKEFACWELLELHCKNLR